MDVTRDTCDEEKQMNTHAACGALLTHSAQLTAHNLGSADIAFMNRWPYFSDSK